ncbi:MAG: sulfur oxidation c-type cytochrome SoxA [Burkholderiales bacterium]
MKPFVAALLAACCIGGAHAQERPVPLRSGLDFTGADVRAMQADDAANPGLLWVERGKALWRTPAGPDDASCATCHATAEQSMRGVAARYPAWDAGAGAVLDLDARIARCRAERQKAPPLARESEDLLALTAFVAFQSRGMPAAVRIDGPAEAAWTRGRDLYFRRHGQMNLACTHCHDRHWGKVLLRETISQGHGTAFPAYRLEWQAVGSLQRRIRACFFGVRAQMPEAGAPELTDLELYLAWRAGGLPLEAPGVRR